MIDPIVMVYLALADLVVLLHLVFVLFVLLGGLFVHKWPRAAWLHLPAAAWGATVEFSGWICPLTSLEHWLRKQAGLPGHSADFIEHYVLAVLYPAGLTRETQVALGLLVVAANLVIYAKMWRHKN